MITFIRGSISVEWSPKHIWFFWSFSCFIFVSFLYLTISFIVQKYLDSCCLFTWSMWTDVILTFSFLFLPHPLNYNNRTSFFWHGRLEWDPTTSSGRYVRENCRPLYVSMATRVLPPCWPAWSSLPLHSFQHSANTKLCAL